MPRKINKKEAIYMFRQEVAPSIPRGDVVWRQTAWNDFTDALCKSGYITNYQYNFWTNPF